MQQDYGIKTIGRPDNIKERFYAFSTERKVKNPAVPAITEAAHKSIFN